MSDARRPPGHRPSQAPPLHGAHATAVLPRMPRDLRLERRLRPLHPHRVLRTLESPTPIRHHGSADAAARAACRRLGLARAAVAVHLGNRIPRRSPCTSQAKPRLSCACSGISGLLKGCGLCPISLPRRNFEACLLRRPGPPGGSTGFRGARPCRRPLGRELYAGGEYKLGG